MNRTRSYPPPIIVTTPNDFTQHPYRANQQETAAQRDAARARSDAAMGNYGAAACEQDRATEHQYRAVQDSRAVSRW